MLDFGHLCFLGIQATQCLLVLLLEIGEVVAKHEYA